MKDKHAAVNVKFDTMFPKGLRDTWMQMIRNWEKDKSKPNPFTYTEKGRRTQAVLILQRLHHTRLATKLADVRKKLADADKEDAERGLTPHQIPASVFIRTGLELEEQQYVYPIDPLFYRLISCTTDDSSHLPPPSQQSLVFIRHHFKNGVTRSQIGFNDGVNSSSFTCPVPPSPHPMTMQT
jgi:hypothetical protein